MNPVSRLMSIARDTLNFAEKSLGPLLDLVIRLWLAQSFFASGLVKAASWDTALKLATNEYPVSWLDPASAAAIGLAIELICPPLIAIGRCAKNSYFEPQKRALIRMAISLRRAGSTLLKRAYSPTFCTRSASSGLRSSALNGPRAPPRGPLTMPR